MALTLVDRKLAGSIFQNEQLYRVCGIEHKTYELAQVEQHSFQEMCDEFNQPQNPPWTPLKIGPDLSQRWVIDITFVYINNASIRADLGTLLLDAGPDGYCGRGFKNDKHWLRTADAGFNVVNRCCMVDNLALAHEVRYNLGAGYHWSANDKPEANHGKILSVNKRRTLRAYSSSCPELDHNYPKILNFCNPGIILNSEPAGKQQRTPNPIAS